MDPKKEAETRIMWRGVKQPEVCVPKLKEGKTDEGELYLVSRQVSTGIKDDDLQDCLVEYSPHFTLYRRTNS